MFWSVHVSDNQQKNTHVQVSKQEKKTYVFPSSSESLNQLYHNELTRDQRVLLPFIFFFLPFTFFTL